MHKENNAMNFSKKNSVRNICRICLLSNKDNRCIFSINIVDKYDNTHIKLQHVLQLYGGIELAENDGLPNSICQECYLKVDDAHTLWKQCQLTDQRLRAIHKKPERNRSVFDSRLVTHKSCQTDSDSSIVPINEVVERKQSLIEDDSSKKKLIERNFIEPPLSDHMNSENIPTECKRSNPKKYRTCRLTAFQRISAIDYSTSHEKHQQSIKKPKCRQKKTDKNTLNKDKYLSLNCRICHRVFKKTQTMINHLNMHTETTPIEVYKILKGIRAEKQLEKSSDSTFETNKCRIEDSEEIIPVESEEESIDVDTATKFINSWMKEELLRTSINNERYGCTLCEKCYFSKKSLIRHIKDTHNSQKKNNSLSGEENTEILKKLTLRCDKCDKTFDTRKQLQNHNRAHRKQATSASSSGDHDNSFKRFLCHVCSRAFRLSTGLSTHMRTHTGYKPHMCKHCGRAFASKANCINHERTHTGDRPFVCHFCSAAFAKSCTLKLHLTIHTGEANYHCKTCGKSFKRLKYLKEHEYTHTGEKPYACKMCGTSYSHSGSLFVHEKRCKAQLERYQSKVADESSLQVCLKENKDSISIITDCNSSSNSMSSCQTSNEDIKDTNLMTNSTI